MKWLLQTGTLLLATLAVPSQAAELQPFRATYDVTYSGIHAGTSDLHLERLPDGRWSYTSRNTVRRLIRMFVPRDKIPADETSLFSIQNGRIVPETYSADDRNSGDARDQQLQFDWRLGRVTGVVERKPVDLPLQAGLQDTMSAQIAMMFDLDNRRLPEHLTVIDKGRIKEYTYSSEGAEQLSTEAGEFQTVIYRSSRVGSDKSTLYWCAPALGYLPLRVEGHEGKDVKWSLAVKSVQRGPQR